MEPISGVILTVIMPKRKNYSGQKYGRLLALQDCGMDKHGNRLWQWQCDCGIICQKPAEKVVRKKDPVKSCGCLRAEIQKHQGNDAVAYAVFSEYRDGDLSYQAFLEMTALDCHYCGRKPSNTRYGRTNKSFSFTYNGLDRKDPNLPHDKGNLVASCWNCNQKKKKDQYQEFLDWIESVYNNCIRN